MPCGRRWSRCCRCMCHGRIRWAVIAAGSVTGPQWMRFCWPAHRVSVECAQWLGHLFIQFGLSPVSRVAGGRRIRALLAGRITRIRPPRGDRLALVIGRWGHDQGALGRGKKPGPIRPIAARRAANAASLPTVAVYR